MIYRSFLMIPFIFSCTAGADISSIEKLNNGVSQVMKLWDVNFEDSPERPKCPESLNEIEFKASSAGPLEGISSGGWKHSFRLVCKNKNYEVEIVTEFGLVKSMIIQGDDLPACRDQKVEESLYHSWGFKTLKSPHADSLTRFFLTKELKSSTKFQVVGGFGCVQDTNHMYIKLGRKQK